MYTANKIKVLQFKKGKRLELTFTKENIQNTNKYIKWCSSSLVI